MKSLALCILAICSGSDVAAFSLSMGSESNVGKSDIGSRRSFLSSASAIVGGAAILLQQPQLSYAAPEILNTASGIKYAITKETKNKKPYVPLKGDIVGIEYTGYLANGQIFDATHAEGKSSELLFKLGEGQVIPGLDDMVSQMKVGQKVQAIIPPKLAYADKGVCLDEDKGGECLIKPGATLVYDISLKKSSIPPP